jgi:hypothetical protein
MGLPAVRSAVALAQHSENPYLAGRYSAARLPLTGRGAVRAMFAWLRQQIETVPPEIAVCEFRCIKSECRVADWQRCAMRIDFAPTPSTRTERLRREA